MIIISKKYYGQLVRCDCGAIIGYSPDEVSRASTIRCPVCTNLIKVLFDPYYDGLIKREDKENETVV